MTALASWRDAMALGERIPEGSSGPWRVERRTIDAEEARLGRLQAAISGTRRYTPEGTYTGLLRNGSVVMSDVPDEMHDHFSAYMAARRRGGRILLHGLGLGMVAQGVLSLSNVEHVDVVEIDADVIALVAPAYQEFVDEGCLTIHHADCFEKRWEPGTRWSVVWHDIWPTICVDNLDEMATLHRKFGRRSDWHGSWCREVLLSARRRGSWR